MSQFWQVSAPRHSMHTFKTSQRCFICFICGIGWGLSLWSGILGHITVMLRHLPWEQLIAILLETLFETNIYPNYCHLGQYLLQCAVVKPIYIAIFPINWPINWPIYCKMLDQFIANDKAINCLISRGYLVLWQPIYCM